MLVNTTIVIILKTQFFCNIFIVKYGYKKTSAQ